MALVTVDDSLLVTEVPMLDNTGLLLVSEISKLVLLKEIEVGHNVDELTDWGEYAAMVRDDTAPIAFPAGETRLKMPWSTKATSASDVASYTAPVNVCQYGTGALSIGETRKVGIVQFHRCLPFDTQFSAPQAWLYAIDGLPAGNYSVTLSSETNGVAAGAYYFALAQAVPAGGQICGFIDSSAKNSIKTYSSRTTTTPLETVDAANITTTNPGDATNLGTFPTGNLSYVVPASGVPAEAKSVTINNVAYTYHGLNYPVRCSYGNNRWLHSAIRQYLNSYGFDWWVPATVFDRPPAYAARQGFLSGCPESLVEHMLPIARMTALNYVTDGGTSGAPEYDTTYDLVTLPSGIEHYLQDTTYYGGGQGKEGEAWEYWKRASGSASPLPWSTWGNESTYHTEYIQYDMASPTTPRNVWMRSAHRGYGYNVAIVGSTGVCYASTATYGLRVAPACAIG